MHVAQAIRSTIPSSCDIPRSILRSGPRCTFAWTCRRMTLSYFSCKVQASTSTTRRVLSACCVNLCSRSSCQRLLHRPSRQERCRPGAGYGQRGCASAAGFQRASIIVSPSASRLRARQTHSALAHSLRKINNGFCAVKHDARGARARCNDIRTNRPQICSCVPPPLSSVKWRGLAQRQG